MTTTTMPKSITERLESLEQQRVRCLELIEAAALCEQVEKEIEGSLVKLFESDVTIYLYLTSGSLEELIARALRVLRPHGWSVADHNITASERRAVYHLSRNGGRRDICLFVAITQAEAVTCRLVEVGKKEVPVYELRCEWANA